MKWMMRCICVEVSYWGILNAFKGLEQVSLGQCTDEAWNPLKTIVILVYVTELLVISEIVCNI